MSSKGIFLGLMLLSGISSISCKPSATEASNLNESSSHSQCFFFIKSNDGVKTEQIPEGELNAFLKSPNAGAGVGASSIMCLTENLVPNETDLKILTYAGMPVMKKRINLSGENEISSFEMVNGQLRLRMISGKFSDRENAEVQIALNKLQNIIQE